MKRLTTTGERPGHWGIGREDPDRSLSISVLTQEGQVRLDLDSGSGLSQVGCRGYVDGKSWGTHRAKLL